MAKWVKGNPGTVKWYQPAPETIAALAEIEASTDRAAAIVGAALVEDHLTTALKAGLNKDQKITDNMFGIYGEMGSFGSKIKLSRLIGMLSAGAAQELHCIRKIRDEFAHKLDAKGFDHGKIKDWTGALERFGNSKFTVSALQGASTLSFVYHPPDGPFTHRQRFIKTCEMYIMILEILAAGGKRVQDSLF